MQKLLMAVLAMVTAFGLQAQIDPSIKIDMYASTCPTDKVGLSGWMPYVDSVQNFWAGTAGESAVISPSGFRPITSGNWRYACVNDTDAVFSMWLGQETPGGTNKGNQIVFPWRIKSPNTPIALSNVRMTLRSWDQANSLGQVYQTLAQYSLEFSGVRPDTTLDAYSPSSTSFPELRAVGPRIGWRATNPAGITTISNYAPFVSGVSCLLEVFRNGTLVATKQLDIPFELSPSTLTQVSKSVVRIHGTTNQQYRLQSQLSLGSAWQPLGLPVSQGDITIALENVPSKFIRAYQGP